MFAVAAVVAASVCVSKAQPYYVVGNYNGWSNPSATAMTDVGPVTGGEEYSYQVTGQPGNTFPNDGFKVTDGTWSTTWPSSNLKFEYDASGNAMIYFYKGNFSDGWSPLQNRVGFADPGNMPLEMAGDFTNPQWGNTIANGNNGTGSDPLAQMTLQAGSVGVYTNIYIVATPGSYNFKFRSPATWGGANIGADMGSGGNCVFTTTTPNQAVLFKLDLPNGRWQAGGPPVYCNVQFSVDMSAVNATDPGYDSTSVTVNGDAIGWGGTACTNDLTAANPNIFTSPYFSIAVGTAVNYQFRYLSSGNTVYDAPGDFGGANRTYAVQNLNNVSIPAVYFNDATLNDYLTSPMAVTFAVDMNGAVGTDTTPWTEGTPVFVNGPWLSWLNWTPIALSSRELVEVGTSGIFTNTFTFPAGFVSSVTYKYSIGGTDNEAGGNKNRFRVIRTTGTGAYSFAQDTFGTQHVEPSFGQLGIAPAPAGKVQLSWLGRPGCKLQTSSSLTSGAWLSLPQTDGTQWTSGVGSPNGLLSVTNIPAGSGSLFFRLIKQ